MKFKTKAGKRSFWVKLQRIFVDHQEPFFCHTSEEFYKAWNNKDFKNEVFWLMEKFAADKFGNLNTFPRHDYVLFNQKDFNPIVAVFPELKEKHWRANKLLRVEFLKWVINDYFRFRDGKNQLTPYALLCGYIQTKKVGETEVKLSQDGIFKVTVSCPIKGYRTEIFSKLQLARKYYNSIKK